MANRTRNIEYKIFVNEEEHRLINEKMKKLNMTNRSAYARKMLCDGMIVNTDYTPIKELSMQIAKVGNNVNQIARQVNAMQNVSKEELLEIKSLMNTISTHQQKTLKVLMQGMKQK